MTCAEVLDDNQCILPADHGGRHFAIIDSYPSVEGRIYHDAVSWPRRHWLVSHLYQKSPRT